MTDWLSTRCFQKILEGLLAHLPAFFFFFLPHAKYQGADLKPLNHPPSFFFFFLLNKQSFYICFSVSSYPEAPLAGWGLCMVSSDRRWIPSLLVFAPWRWKNKCFIKLKLALSNKTSPGSVNDWWQQETAVLASPIEVTAVNGGYYGKILARSFLFLFSLPSDS